MLVQGNDESAYEIYPWLRHVPGVGRLMRSGLLSAQSTLVVNQGLADWVGEVRATVSPSDTPEHVEILPTGVSDLYHDVTDRRADLGRYALFFGNLVEWQGVNVLLDAFESPEWPADLRLVVVGSGPVETEVRRRRHPGLEFLGHLPPEELAPIIAGAVCTLCPKLDVASMAETTTPLKMLESVAAGTPVVASDIPAQRRMIESDGYGILTRAGDHRSLAQGVAAVSNDDEARRRLIDAARAAGAELRWEHAAPILGDAIRSAAGARR
jgi:glycosyltransferase involved in cell wall biosynthesis